MAMQLHEERVSLKITSFNVNSLKSCLKRTGHKTLQAFLDSFDSDIVCLQELKLSTEEAFKWKEWAGLETWVAFCDFATNRNGYSGTGTFVKTAMCLPEKVEIGLLPKDAMLHGDTVEDFASWNEERLAELNQEGRVVVTHHGDFVLFNLYGPAISSDDDDKIKTRMEYKVDFFKVLERRMVNLKMRDGHTPCRIVVVGDFNIAPSPCDYPGPVDPQFYSSSRPDRLWMKNLLSGDHILNMCDAFRVFHPNRRNAFTVWDTKTNARVHNHGSRIDLTLVSGFEINPNGDGWSECCYIVNADICPDIHGSDHCPVFVHIGKTGAWTCSEVVPPESMRRLAGSDLQKKITSFLVPVRPSDERQEQDKEATLCDLPTLVTKKKRKQIDLKTLFPPNNTSSPSTENFIPDHLQSDYAASEAYFTALHHTAKSSWASIQQKMKAPMCSCKIPAAKKKVTKSTSKKKGAFFYCCSKPAGGGNCNFFQWLS